MIPDDDVNNTWKNHFTQNEELSIFLKKMINTLFSYKGQRT